MLFLYNEHRPVTVKYKDDSYNHDKHVSITMFILHTCIRNSITLITQLMFPRSKVVGTLLLSLG